MTSISLKAVFRQRYFIFITSVFLFINAIGCKTGTLTDAETNSKPKPPEIEQSKQLVRTQNYSTNECVGSTFTPDSKFLLGSARYGNHLCLTDVQTGKIVNKFVGVKESSSVLASSPDGSTIATDSNTQGLVTLWNTKSGVEMKTFSSPSKTSSIYSIAFSPDGKTIMTGHYIGELKLWDVASGTLKKDLESHKSSVWEVKFSPDGEIAASGGADRNLKIWNAQSGALMHTLPMNYDGVYFTFSPDSKTLLVADYNRTGAVQEILVKRVDISKGKETKVQKFPKQYVYSIGFEPQNKYIAIIGAGDAYDTPGLINIYDLQTEELKLTLKGHSKAASGEFSPDGKMLATTSLGNNGNEFKLWDLSELK